MFTCSEERQDEIERWKSRGERETDEVKEVPRLQELSGGTGYLWPRKVTASQDGEEPFLGGAGGVP